MLRESIPSTRRSVLEAVEDLLTQRQKRLPEKLKALHDKGQQLRDTDRRAVIALETDDPETLADAHRQVERAHAALALTIQDYEKLEDLVAQAAEAPTTAEKQHCQAAFLQVAKRLRSEADGLCQETAEHIEALEERRTAFNRRMTSVDRIHCLACGQEGDASPYCPHCGAARPERLTCHHCGDEFLLPVHLLTDGTEQAATHCSNDFRLAADDPPLRIWRRQIPQCQRSAVRTDDVAYARSALFFAHVVLPPST